MVTQKCDHNRKEFRFGLAVVFFEMILIFCTCVKQHSDLLACIGILAPVCNSNLIRLPENESRLCSSLMRFRFQDKTGDPLYLTEAQELIRPERNTLTVSFTNVERYNQQLATTIQEEYYRRV